MHDRIEIAPGVLHHMDHAQAVYTGTPAAVVAAGLARAQDVDAPGIRTINPDGSRAVRGQNYGQGQAIGKKVIQVRNVARSVTVQVRVWLSHERLEAIKAQRAREAACWPFPMVVGSTPRGNPFASAQGGTTAGGAGS